MHESDAPEHPTAEPSPAQGSADGESAPRSETVPADSEGEPAEGVGGESATAQPEGTLGFEPPVPAAEQSASETPAEPAAESAPEPVSASAPVPKNEPAPVGSEPPRTEFAPPAEPTAAEPAAAEPAVEAPAAATPGPAAEGAQRESPDVVTSEPSKKPPVDPAKAAQEAARNEERKRRAQAAWERVVGARESGEVLTGTVTAAVKGGLLVDVGGIRGFLPASQVRVQQGTALETMVRTKLPLKVIDVDQNRRRIVVSHRRAADEERRTKRTELLRSLAVGQTREGTVVRLTDFGAFVDLGGVDGLIPMRELAFERIDKAGDVVKIGEKLPVEVLRIDENGKKISLSRRNALPDPWRDHANVLRQGQTVEGKVVSKEPRLEVELAPGVVGTVRESDANPADYEIGEAIEVVVRRADRATRRITLSPAHGAAAQPPPQSGSGSGTTGSGFAPLGVELGRRRS